MDSYHLALICLGLDQKDQAMVWLERAWQERASDDLGVVYIKVDPSLDNLRADPRFKALLKKMGLEK